MLAGIPALIVVDIDVAIHVLEAHAVGSPSVGVESSLPVVAMVAVMPAIPESPLLTSEATVESAIEALIVLRLPKITVSPSPHIQSIIRPAIKYILMWMIAHTIISLPSNNQP